MILEFLSKTEPGHIILLGIAGLLLIGWIGERSDDDL